MKIVCLSDTHGQHSSISVPNGDVLVFSGDMAHSGSVDDVKAFNQWLNDLPHKHKLVVAGNHDLCLDAQRFPSVDPRDLLKGDGIVYLEDSAVTIEGVTFYGSPYTPEFYDWAFMLPRGQALHAKWQQIPDDVDVLIVHGPPARILDLTVFGVHAGCEALRERLKQVAPKLVVFGHIHEGAGHEMIDGTLYVNASVVAYPCRVEHAPTVVELSAETATISP